MADPSRNPVGLFETADSMSTPPTGNWSDCRANVDLWTNFTPIVIAVVFVVGLLGNGSLIVIWTAYKEIRTPPSLLIINMSVGDILLLIFMVPDLLGFYLRGGWTMPLFLCKGIKCTHVITQGVSVLTFTALSYDRYEAISCPISRRNAGRRRVRIRTTTIIAAIWSASCVIAIPALLWAFIAPCGDCRLPMQEQQMKYYIVVMFVVVYLLPFVVVLFFYILIALMLIQGTGEVGRHIGAAARRKNSRNRLALVVLFAALLFAVLWLPYYIVSLLFEFIPEESVPIYFERLPMYFLLDLSYLCALLSSCTNPLLLYAVSSNYRRKLKCLFSTCPCHRSTDRTMLIHLRR